MGLPLFARLAVAGIALMIVAVLPLAAFLSPPCGRRGGRATLGAASGRAPGRRAPGHSAASACGSTRGTTSIGGSRRDGDGDDDCAAGRRPERAGCEGGESSSECFGGGGWDRRELLLRGVRASAAVGSVAVVAASLPAATSARGLPESTGASGAGRGTAERLAPILGLKLDIEHTLAALGKSSGSSSSRSKEKAWEEEDLLKSFAASRVAMRAEPGIPMEEKAVKRLFDEFSDPITPKDQWKDKNAFVVYYSKGFDGPGRPSMEADEDGSEARRNLQYGLRNDFWVAISEAKAETEYLRDSGEEDVTELRGALERALKAVTEYTELAPLDVLEEARRLTQ